MCQAINARHTKVKGGAVEMTVEKRLGAGQSRGVLVIREGVLDTECDAHRTCQNRSCSGDLDRAWGLVRLGRGRTWKIGRMDER